MAFLNARSDVDTPTKDLHAAPRVPPTQAPAAKPRAPFFRWREQWCVGIEALDRDRRALAAILNHIALRFGERSEARNQEPTDLNATVNAPDAIGIAGGPAALRYWLDVLGERAREHFAREDALMRATHYPDTAAHVSEHALMLAEYTVLVRSISARGDERLHLGDLDALKQWFLGHLLDLDKQLGAYLRANGVSALRPRTTGRSAAAAGPEHGAASARRSQTHPPTPLRAEA